MERKRIAEAAKGVGKPKVGGRFDLVDQEGRPFTEENLKGKYALVCLLLLSHGIGPFGMKLRTSGGFWDDQMKG
jgi:hypothetical protein